MGARDVKRRFLFEGLSVLLLFLDTVSLVEGKNLTYSYDPDEQEAVQTVWEAWQNTPDKGSNLAGWNPTENDFCEYAEIYSLATFSPSWQGVQCTAFCNSTDVNCTDLILYVTGLSLPNASIEGVLPPAIGNFTYLLNLELTGNPNLTGPLPQELQDTSLNVLDVHDNAFNGTIPFLPLLWSLLRLDLSGNQFTGPYPSEQFLSMSYLQELSISNNLFYGPIQADAFSNKTELKTLDISDNFFNGTLPNLTPMHQLTHLDVSGNQFEGPLPDLTGFSTLRYVDLGSNSFTGTANWVDIFNLSASTALAFVNLSSNQLTGPLPSWNASNLGSVEELYLDSNNLTGTLDISSMFSRGLLPDLNSPGTSSKKLGIMSLINNSIQHVISSPYIIENTSTVFFLQENPYCDIYDSNDDTQRCYCSQFCFVTKPDNQASKNEKKAENQRIIIISATTSVAAVLLILLIVVGAILIKNRRYKRYLQLQFEQKFEEFNVKPTIFSYNELRGATRDFHQDMKLGEGAYGAVYKGVLPSGNVVAVKQLFVKTAQGQDDFLNEVVLITGMKHRNLVNLKGCCLRESQKLLVYEYVDNFDVDRILLGSKKQEMSGRLASWPVRLKICLGIARGLHYLHALAHPRIIHRDIKAANILLDSNLEPKIADFGLALLFPDEQSHITTVHVAGTKGYLAPEYASLGQLSDKVDVYSFGVLCLEIISGRRNIDDTAPLEQVYLSQWAWQLYKDDKLLDLVDPTLHTSEEEVRDVQRVIKVCLLCISNAIEKRPSMARIVSILQGDIESEVHVLQEERLNSSTLLQRSKSGQGNISQEESSFWSQSSKSGLERIFEEGNVLEKEDNFEEESNKSFLIGSHRKSRGRRQSNGSDTFGIEIHEIRAQ